MGRFVKPILAHDAAGPDRRSTPRGLLDLPPSASASRSCARTTQHNQLQLLTMSAADFLDQWFETDVLKATMSRRRASSARSSACARRAPRTCCCTTTWARSTAPSARGASSRGGTGAIARRSPAPPRAGAEIRTEAPVARDPRRRDGRATGVVLENGDEIQRRRRAVERRSAAHLPERSSSPKQLPAEFVRGRAAATSSAARPAR